MWNSRFLWAETLGACQISLNNYFRYEKVENYDFAVNFSRGFRKFVGPQISWARVLGPLGPHLNPALGLNKKCGIVIPSPIPIPGFAIPSPIPL